MIVASLLLLFAAGPAAPEEVFRTAEGLYGEGRFEEAASAYETLLSRGIEDGALHYNLGNAYFRRGAIGRAILSYERALRLLPGDADVRANLALAYERAGTAPAPPDLPDALVRVVETYRALAPESCARLLSLAFLAGGAVCLLLVLGAAPPRGRSLMLAALGVAGALALGSAALLGAKLSAASGVEAIVLAPAAAVRSGPGASHPELAEAREGLKVEVVGSREEWLQIALPEGITGWVPRSAAEII